MKSRKEQVREVQKRMTKMSIAGVQPKLSVKEEVFKVVDKHGSYIFKPPLNDYENVPENEDVTMRMSTVCGNVGILFFFPEEGRVKFVYPNRLQRISGLYSDFNVNFLKKYLRAFDKQAKKLTKQSSKEAELFDRSDFSEIIGTHFLNEDATALLFSDIKKGTCEDAGQIIDYYQDQYLSVYDPKKECDRKDEEYIINKVEEGVRSTNPDYIQEIKREYTLETPYLSQQFDFVWKNGTTNLVTLTSSRKNLLSVRRVPGVVDWKLFRIEPEKTILNLI